MSFIPSADPPSQDDNATEDGSDKGKTRSPTTLAFSFLPDYRLDISVRSLVGSRARLQDVPKIAQIVEARIHQWFDERCVEPRVQQIILPNMWPRKKNTRGGDDEDEDDDGNETAIEDDMGDELVSKANGKADTVKDVSNDDSLEARMAATGKALREAETSEERVQRLKDQQSQPALRRRPGHKTLLSTDALKMPGHFD